MTKITASADGGAMPKINRADVMRRAWSIFRTTYKFPAIKFAHIGRDCFAWALRKAWSEVRAEARIAAIPAAAKSARIEGLQAQISLASYSENWRQARCDIAAARAEIALLSA